jgi:hypothetical protein
MAGQGQGMGQRIGNQLQRQPMGDMAQNVGQQLGNQMQRQPMGGGMAQGVGQQLAGQLQNNQSMDAISAANNAAGQQFSTMPVGKPFPLDGGQMGQRNQMQLKPMPWSGIPRGPQMDPGYFDTSIGMTQLPQNVDPGFYNPSMNQMNQMNQQQMQQMQGQQYPSQYRLMQKMGRM